MLPLPPLTHHQILVLVEPFTRAGHRIDMAASDRAAHRLVFRPVAQDRLAAAVGLAGCRGRCRDMATLPQPAVVGSLAGRPRGADSPNRVAPAAVAGRVAETAPGTALLWAEGLSPAALLARVEAIALQAQCVVGDGHVSCYRQQLLPPPPAGSPDVPAERLQLTEAQVMLPLGYHLSLKVPRVKGISAELRWQRLGGAGIAPPPDLLAVLGMAWSRLDPDPDGWRATLRLRGEGLVRSRDAQGRLAQAAAHLAQTLSQSPAAFHPRFRRQRWAATLRRAVPLAVCVGLVVAAAAVPWMNLAEDSTLRMLIFNAPPILLGLFFCLPEMPRFEIPPRPRPLAAPHWTLPSA